MCTDTYTPTRPRQPTPTLTPRKAAIEAARAQGLDEEVLEQSVYRGRCGKVGSTHTLAPTHPPPGDTSTGVVLANGRWWLLGSRQTPTHRYTHHHTHHRTGTHPPTHPSSNKLPLPRKILATDTMQQPLPRKILAIGGSNTRGVEGVDATTTTYVECLIHRHPHVHTHTYTHAHACTRARTGTRTCTRTRTRTRICARYTHARARAHPHSHAQVPCNTGYNTRSPNRLRVPARRLVSVYAQPRDRTRKRHPVISQRRYWCVGE